MIRDKVKVGGFDYTVEVSNKVLALNNRVCTGIIDYHKHIIRINDRKTLSEKYMEQTWWHEILHAIIDWRGISLSNDPEVVVDEIAKGLLQLMQDNPGPLPGQRSDAVEL